MVINVVTKTAVDNRRTIIYIVNLSTRKRNAWHNNEFVALSFIDARIRGAVYGSRCWHWNRTMSRPRSLHRTPLWFFLLVLNQCLPYKNELLLASMKKRKQ
jgi:hypothetical protein